MLFRNESEFEEALVKKLGQKGWSGDVLKYKTEEELIENWAQILFENNQSQNKLNHIPLTKGEMNQVIEKVKELKTPLKLNHFINGKTVEIKRDHPDDIPGRMVDLKIYDRQEIAGGQSRYQIVRQPYFTSKKDLVGNGRGDVLLLINGMPVIHIELKASGVPLEEAECQIERYANRGYFRGLYSLIQVFVVMTPEETRYFANPGPGGVFNRDYFFHWGDFNNEPINDWEQIAEHLLSIPMAHQLIGFYTVPDETDGILKVMRSYQYYASSLISSRVAKIDWASPNQRGGYIWHTTGSGKTMTSFKSAQLIAASGNADKVVFLLDRIELSTQSSRAYQALKDPRESVFQTENSYQLLDFLKSDYDKTLIVTSIQKMSRIKEESGMNVSDLEKISKKRIVFIVDECHRSTFGSMMKTIKATCERAVFFGFTGTPIFKENDKFGVDTTDIFGEEIHRYTLADGIRDKNVLGFNVEQVKTFSDEELRKDVALEKARAASVEEALADEVKRAIYDQFMAVGEQGKGIENYLSEEQYTKTKHKQAVVQDILQQWPQKSRGGRLSAILATSSIPEAIEYYRLFKKNDSASSLKISALFDPTIDNKNKERQHLDNKEGQEFKEEGIREILRDYNSNYQCNFDIPRYEAFKRDVALRLAKKGRFKRADKQEQLDLLIVVNQMLTGYDSKWVGTLYLDKTLEYANIIQAFSRTNRLCEGDIKPFGSIRYYRRPNTMKINIAKAVELYSGDRSYGLFVPKLGENITSMNQCFSEITALFRSVGIENFEKLPENQPEKNKFGKLFRKLVHVINSAEIQGVNWEEQDYSENNKSFHVEITQQIFKVLVERYKEIGPHPPAPPGLFFPIDTAIYLASTERIDDQYMNEKFKKYHRALQEHANPKALSQVLDELHRSYSFLSESKQRVAEMVLHDLQAGELKFDNSKTFRDYISEYEVKQENSRLNTFARLIGLDPSKLKEFLHRGYTEKNLNDYGKFQQLKDSVDKKIAAEFIEKIEGKKVTAFEVNMKIEQLLNVNFS